MSSAVIFVKVFLTRGKEGAAPTQEQFVVSLVVPCTFSVVKINSCEPVSVAPGLQV